MNGKLENNVTPARGRARFRPGHPVYTYDVEGERSVRAHYVCLCHVCYVRV